MSKSRIPRWAALILLGVGLLAVGIPGLFVYMSLTATKVHPDSQNIPSLTNSPPLPRWAAAAGQAREILLTSMSANNLAGLSVAADIDGEIVWAEGLGFADVQSGSPVTPNHRFRTGTASALLISAAIGVLVEEGRLKLDEEIQHYVPEFPTKQWPVTVRQVMGHVAGLQGEDPDNGVLTSSHCERAADAVALFAKEPLAFQSGTEYRDSTFGWVLLSAAVEAAAHTPLATFLNEKVLGPVGMRDTFKESLKNAPADAATSYNPRFAANPVYGLRPLPQFDYSCYAGANGFLSTPSDLARFGMAIHRGKLLRPETVQMFETAQRLTSGKQTSYGLGWELKTVTIEGQPVPSAGYSGHFWVETVATLLTLPERGVSVALMSNVSYAGTYALAERVAQVFAEERGKQRELRR